MCRHFREDFGLQTRVARFHNVYGPFGTWTAAARRPRGDLPQDHSSPALGQTGDRDLGTGERTRSFMYIDDCLKGIQAIALRYPRAAQPGFERTGEHQPARGHRRGDRGVKLKRIYDPSAPLE